MSRPDSSSVQHERSAVIVGAGMVTPLGLDAQTTWRALRAGKSGIGMITHFDSSGLEVHIAGQVPASGAPYFSNFLGREARAGKEEIAFRALDEALRSANLSASSLRERRVGIFTACEKQSPDALQLFDAYEKQDGSSAALLEAHLSSIAQRYGGSIAHEFRSRFGGAVVTANYAMACAAGAIAVAQAVRWLRRRRIDTAVVVAADTPITSGTVHGFQMLEALSRQNAQPTRASCPFDAERDGFVLAEGAGALVLEAGWRSAPPERPAPRWGRIVGVGTSNNADQLTKTPRDGARPALALRNCLEDARVAPAQVGYINAHATSTDVGDISETNAIANVFDPPPPVSSTKSMTGHLVAAAGLVELIITTLALRDGFLPPTINQTRPDPDCHLDVIPNRGRTTAAAYAISNSFGFGGTNVALLVGKA